MKERILDEIKALFSDTSQTPEQTRQDLSEILEEVEMLIDALGG